MPIGFPLCRQGLPPSRWLMLLASRALCGSEAPDEALRCQHRPTLPAVVVLLFVYLRQDYRRICNCCLIKQNRVRTTLREGIEFFNTGGLPLTNTGDVMVLRRHLWLTAPSGNRQRRSKRTISGPRPRTERKLPSR
jgi:hypothetical protein